ncbi:transaldolase family protein [Cellulomonas aerilata]|uniref:Transaldolase n=1 Tax=Cellulomonas aerilata TaxID=515326 RepID=A0A512DDL0_9CELL|nr:transaldolase family protein [Cellulomonas aerilata]GEO34559.1 transaldolase [Cellulomonas aerilata]
MDLYLDSADREALGPLLRTGVFAGVTTNPLILERAGVRLGEVPELTRWLLDAGAREVFLQTTTSDVEAVVAEGHALRALSDRVVVKVPATVAGLTATAELARAGVPTLLTAVYHVRQAVLARAVGAAWIAPYLGRMTEAGRDGRRHVEQMQGILTGSGTRVLVASIRSVDDVHRLAVAGIDAVTVSAAVARELLEEPLTAAAVDQFDEAVTRLR